MFWCCPILDCDKKNTVSSCTRIFGPRPNSRNEVNTARLHDGNSPVDGSHTNPCLDDLSQTEQDVIYSRSASEFPDSPCYSSSSSPEYYRATISYDVRDHISVDDRSRVPSVDRSQPSGSNELNLNRDCGPRTTVSTVASLAEQRTGFRKWWKFGFRSLRSGLQETVHETLCNTQPTETHQPVEQLRTRTNRGTGCACVLVRKKKTHKKTTHHGHAPSLSFPTTAAFVSAFADDTILLDNTALELEYASQRDASVIDERFSATPLRDSYSRVSTPSDMDGSGPDTQSTAGRRQARSSRSPVNTLSPRVQRWLQEPISVHRNASDLNCETRATETSHRRIFERGFSQDTAFQYVGERSRYFQPGETSRSDLGLRTRGFLFDQFPTTSTQVSHTLDQSKNRGFMAGGRSCGVSRMMSLPTEAEASLSSQIVKSEGEPEVVWQPRVGGGLHRQSSLDSGEPDEPSRPTRLWNTESTSPSDDEDDEKGCTPLSDVEQLNQVNEDMAELLESSDSASGADKIKVQCVALWQLRSTLEDEDPDSDNLKTGQTPDESSPDSDIADKPGTPSNREGDPNTILMTPEARRTSYRAILARRLKHQEGSAANLPSETSFDSVDTDNSSIADFTRLEANASVDSAFDVSVDSVPETRGPKSYQMRKADSGYRSMEVSSTSRYSMASWSQNTFEEGVAALPSFNVEGRILTSDNDEKSTEDDEMSSNKSPDDPVDTQQQHFAKSQQFHLSRKLWHSVSVEPSFMDTEVPCSSKQANTLESKTPSSKIVCRKRREMDVSRNDEISGKRSVMHRFMSPQKYSPSQIRALQRDYSIDEKSDRLFKEFSRTEPFCDMEYNSYTVPRRGRRNRRRVRHLEVTECSPRSHRRKISPQDSIEEESSMDTRDSSLTRSEGAIAVTASPEGSCPSTLWPPSGQERASPQTSSHPNFSQS